MKSFIFGTSYVKKERQKKWLKYYTKRMHYTKFGASGLYLVDDGSPIEDINSIREEISVTGIDNNKELPDVCIIRFSDHFGRQDTEKYSGWWRSFIYSYAIAERLGADKIIHIESDAFVVSTRLRKYIEKLSSGWTALWCPRYSFPETSIQIICKDSFGALKDLYDRGEDFYRDKSLPIAERFLPFTHVEKGFVGDRYGEPWCTHIPLNADYICQGADLYIPKLYEV